MRRPRILAPKGHKTAFYHCVSRVVNREFVLGEAEKEQFVSYMRLYERLYGLRVVAYCIMSNHFHVLVEVPKRPETEELWSNEKLVAHVRRHLGDIPANELAADFKQFAECENLKGIEELRERWFGRMWNVSTYMKVLKQRFTQWFNKKHGRRGTLWEDRFRSVLVQSESHALRAMAAYIDLNPVRAGICDDPKDYRWCGYGEALGSKKAKRAREAVIYLASLSSQGGMKHVSLRPRTMRQGLEGWRRFLYGVPEGEPALEAQQEHIRKGQEKTTNQERPPLELHEITHRRGVSREKALEILENGGRLSEVEYLHCRVRYFCDGAAMGGKAFVEEIFTENREKFGKMRKEEAKLVRSLTLKKPEERLYNLRNLRKDVFS